MPSWTSIALLGATVIVVLSLRGSFPPTAPAAEGLDEVADSAAAEGSGEVVSPPSAADKGAVPLTPIPLPDESYSGRPVDPKSFAAAVIVPLTVALDAARANAPEIVGDEPLIRLMQVTNDGGPTDAERLEGLYWVILSPDATTWVSSTHVDTPGQDYTFYGWVFVDMEGTVRDLTVIGYPKGGIAPPDLPDR
jgi:hypothetical protein